MKLRTIGPGRAALYAVVVVATIASFAVSQGLTLFTGPGKLNPRLVFGVLATLIVVVVALGRLFGSDQTVQEGWTLTHIAVASVWTLYLFSGLGLVLSGFTGWVVLGNLAIAVVAGLAFWYLYDPK